MRKNGIRPTVAEAIIAEYKPQTVFEMQEAEVFGSMFEVMLNGEMTGYLGGCGESPLY